MFKLVVLSALLAIAYGKPSLLHTALVAPLHTAYIAPSAVSHQSRVDIHSTPVHAAWPYWSAPLALGHHTPATVLTPHGVPLETAEVVAAKAFHLNAHALANHGYHHLLRKRSLLPLVHSPAVIVAPLAVSHQSRVDVHSSPVLVAAPHYALPHYGHYSPLLSYSHWPALHHW